MGTPGGHQSGGVEVAASEPRVEHAPTTGRPCRADIDRNRAGRRGILAGGARPAPSATGGGRFVLRGGSVGGCNRSGARLFALPTGEAWSVDINWVYDSVAMQPAIDGVPQGSSYGPTARSPGEEIGCCAPLNVITADPTAVAVRVTTNHGDRFSIPLRDLPGTDGLRVAVIALAGGGGPQRAELIDAAGNRAANDARGLVTTAHN